MCDMFLYTHGTFLCASWVVRPRADDSRANNAWEPPRVSSGRLLLEVDWGALGGGQRGSSVRDVRWVRLGASKMLSIKGGSVWLSGDLRGTCFCLQESASPGAQVSEALLKKQPTCGRRTVLFPTSSPPSPIYILLGVLWKIEISRMLGVKARGGQDRFRRCLTSRRAAQKKHVEDAWRQCVWWKRGFEDAWRQGAVWKRKVSKMLGVKAPGGTERCRRCLTSRRTVEKTCFEHAWRQLAQWKQTMSRMLGV